MDPAKEPPPQNGRNGTELSEIKVDGMPPAAAADVKHDLAQDASQFMQQVMSFRADGKVGHRTSSMFDNAARVAHLEQATSFAQVSKIIPVTLEWRELSYTILVGKKKTRTTKRILDSLSAQVPSGRLLAVMGPSGSGKTSLVNALAGRLSVGGELHGEVLVNGLPRGRGFRSISAYVMQDDVLFSNLTVRETFEFAARMRLPSDVSTETKQSVVDSIISELGLSKASDTRIGNEFMRGVSGGERKRTNIGIELLSGASLLFLDEPTSGLDAFQAQNVMESLLLLAGNRRTVITSIHQPRSSIYKMFDLLLLLSEGRAVYYGPAAAATAWFASAGFQCPAEFNPADFFLDVVSMDYRSPELEASSRKRIQLLGDLYASDGSSTAGPHVPVPEEAVRSMQQANKDVAFPNLPPTEFGLLLQRAWKQQGRDRLPQVITLVQTIVIGFFLAALYSQMDKSATGIQDEIGILFFITIFSAFGAMFGALNSFPMERGVVNRERSSKMYHVSPYYLARFICDVPLRVGQGLLFGVIIYWIVGLNPSAKAFFIFCGILILEGLASQGLGIAVSAGSKNEKVALALAPAITVILILFGGFYVNEGTIPEWLSWIKYISHLYWAFMALTINDFHGRDGWACGAAGVAPPPTCKTGDQIIQSFGFNPTRAWLGVVGLLALIVGFNLLGYLLLRRSKPKFLPLTDADGKKVK